MPIWPGWPGLQVPEKPPEGTFRCPACGNTKPERFLSAAPEASKWRGQVICKECSWGENIDIANARLKEEAEKEAA